MTSGKVAWLSPSDPPDAFPDVEKSLREPDGLLAAGGDLSIERLLAAYRAGIFPWYEEGQPILWWSPNPRCVLRPADLHISRRLTREMKHSPLVLRFDTAFDDVVRACAGPRRFQQGTWITDDMRTAYERLHVDGWAHSVEVWDEQRLVGGLYGLCIGRVFFGESMFSLESNASKLALAGLARHMLAHGMELLDCQVVSRHLATLGATMIPRPAFTDILRRTCNPAIRHQKWPEADIRISELAKN